MRALTGLDLVTFCALAEPFTAGCQAEADAGFSVEQPRQRRRGGGRKGVLASPEQKLLFILFYLKTYPTFDVLGATFGLPRSKACEHAHRLAKALERCLRTLGVLPARVIDSLAQMQALFVDVPVLLLDEPTASLDAVNREVVLTLIADAKARGTAIVGIFHDEAARNRVCDRVIDVTDFTPVPA